MKDGADAMEGDTNPGALPFADFGAAGAKQSLDIPPCDPRTDRIGEDGFQRCLMLPAQIH